jgi:hypothetical protein
MPKFTDVNTLPFTSEQLVYFEAEMRKYKVPWLYKIVFGTLFKYGAIFMPILFLIIVALGIVHMTTRYDLWNVIKGFAFFWIFFIGIITAIAWIFQRIKVKKECKRLGLTLYQWNLLATVFQITYI